MERALINFMLDLHTREHGYREVLPPFLVGMEALRTGQLRSSRAISFKVEGHGLSGADRRGPAHQPAPEEILENAEILKHYTAYTPCFRSEAGSTEKTCAVSSASINSTRWSSSRSPTRRASFEELESLTRNAEEVLKRLGLPIGWCCSARETWVRIGEDL
jgi:seryl-tRNA synthetase